MTTDEIIRMARECGLHIGGPPLEPGLARFVELISADQREAWEDALKDAFFEGFTSVATYNDTILNSPEEAWEKYKPSRAKTNK